MRLLGLGWIYHACDDLIAYTHALPFPTSDAVLYSSEAPYSIIA